MSYNSNDGALDTIQGAPQTPEVIAYTVAHGFTMDQLCQHVKEDMAKGWQPFGGVAAMPLEVGGYYMQAMVLYKGGAQ